jgi:hypothetical protein
VRLVDQQTNQIKRDAELTVNLGATTKSMEIVRKHQPEQFVYLIDLVYNIVDSDIRRLYA